ncbi:putative thioredoxin reductase [Xylariaceae sp. FL1019]|nr:putative thioredoxin reductase [Xylariaceae sp. FL1019]
MSPLVFAMRLFRSALTLPLLFASSSKGESIELRQLTPSVLHSSTVYDAIIVGGGPSGLSALSGLARVRRNVLLIDSGEYRNGPTRHTHDVIGSDGVTPAYFRWKAREQISSYPTVSAINGTVDKIDVDDTASKGTLFSVKATFPSGEKATVGARKIVLATGLRDVLPLTPGIRENWGQGIFWCLWCDGYEHADQSMGLLCDLSAVPGNVFEVETLNSDIIAFVNGTDTEVARAKASRKVPDWERFLAQRNVTIENRTIERVTRLANGSEGSGDRNPNAATAPEHDLFRVDFLEKGPSVERAAFLASFPVEQQSSLGADMGIRIDGVKLFADQSIGLQTNIAGVYAVGDANSDNSTNVPHAMYSGKRAAVYMHIKLSKEDISAAVATDTLEERTSPLDPRAVWEEMNGGSTDFLDAGEFRDHLDDIS